jgi:hypothetical protein
MNKYDQDTVIDHCVALAFHKALIGVSQLNAIESAIQIKEFGQFRQSKAIITYYIVYHVFVACMLKSKYYTPINPKDYGDVSERTMGCSKKL